MDLFPSGKDDLGTDRNRLSFMRRNWRRAKFIAGGPVANVGFQEISEGRRFIGGLWRLLRRGVPTDTRLKLDEEGSIDLLATAFSYGMTVEALVERLRFRRGQTARAAYAMFGLGSVSLVLWLHGRPSYRDDQRATVLGVGVPAVLHAIFSSCLQERLAELATQNASAGLARRLPEDDRALSAALIRTCRGEPACCLRLLRLPTRRARNQAAPDPLKDPRASRWCPPG